MTTERTDRLGRALSTMYVAECGCGASPSVHSHNAGRMLATPTGAALRALVEAAEAWHVYAVQFLDAGPALDEWLRREFPDIPVPPLSDNSADALLRATTAFLAITDEPEEDRTDGE